MEDIPVTDIKDMNPSSGVIAINIHVIALPKA